MQDEIAIRQLGPQDGAMLDQVLDGVFDNAICPRQTERFLGTEGHVMFVARRADVVVGMGSAVIILHPDKRPQAFVNELAVDPEYQRRGIGRRIMQALFDWARAQGCAEAWLGTEHDNIAACETYRSLTPDTEESFVLFSFELGQGEGPGQ